MILFETFYLIFNAFSTYIVLYAYSFILGKRKTGPVVFYLSFAGYFIISSLMYLLFDVPLLNLAINILLWLAISFNYQASLAKKIIAVVSLFVFMAAIESIVVMLYNVLGLQYKKTAEMTLIWGMSVSKLLTFILCGTVLRKIDIKNKVKMTVRQTLSVFLVSAGILFLTYVLMTIQYNNRVLELISIISLFIICIFIFYFINITSKEYHDKEQKKQLEMQSNSYLHELNIVNKAQKEIRFIKHDMANHLNTIQSLVMSGEMKKAGDYIKSISKKMNATEKVSNTDIAELDSIINFKVSTAKENSIRVNESIQIKEKVLIPPQDYISIIGNLFDNAIEALVASRIDDKYINFTIGSINGLFVIVFENPYRRPVLTSGGIFLTTKRAQKDHGFGLINVETIVSKYNGTVHISYDKNFVVELSMINK